MQSFTYGPFPRVSSKLQLLLLNLLFCPFLLPMPLSDVCSVMELILVLSLKCVWDLTSNKSHLWISCVCVASTSCRPLFTDPFIERHSGKHKGLVRAGETECDKAEHQNQNKPLYLEHDQVQLPLNTFCSFRWFHFSVKMVVTPLLKLFTDSLQATGSVGRCHLFNENVHDEWWIQGIMTNRLKLLIKS